MERNSNVPIKGLKTPGKISKQRNDMMEEMHLFTDLFTLK